MRQSLLLVVLGLSACSDDPQRPEAGTDRGWHLIDLLGVDQKGAQDASSEPSGPCSSTDITRACGGGDHGQWCDFGTCKPCPAGKLNCNLTDSCECSTACEGNKCRGAAACDYSDPPPVCGGDQTRWCYLNQCESCTSGYWNCDGTAGCECAKGCDGTKCLP